MSKKIASVKRALLLRIKTASPYYVSHGKSGSWLTPCSEIVFRIYEQAIDDITQRLRPADQWAYGDAMHFLRKDRLIERIGIDHGWMLQQFRDILDGVEGLEPDDMPIAHISKHAQAAWASL